MSEAQEKIRYFEVDESIRVKTYDIDFAGHVSNIVYLRWFEDLRLSIFDRYFPLPSLMNLGYLPILTQSRIEYKKSIGLFDKPQGHMWIDSIKEARFEFEGEILVDARLTTRVWHTGVFLSKETMKPVRIPQLIKQRFVELYGKPIKPVH